MSLERVETNGVVLATRIWPGPDPSADRIAVAIHGLTANHTCWYPVADVVTRTHRLLAYDLRGRGDSDKPATGYSLAIHDADLLGLLDHHGIGRAVVMGHSLGATIGVRFAAHHPDRVERLVLIDGGFDVRAQVADSIRPALDRLGVAYRSLDALLATLQGWPFFAGRWNEHLTRYFTYDVEPAAEGGVRSKVSQRAIDEELANLLRTRIWPWHHRITAPTLLFRAPQGLLTADDCVMTPEEATALAHAIPRCRFVEVPDSNHYTILLATQPVLRRELAAFLAGA